MFVEQNTIGNQSKIQFYVSFDYIFGDWILHLVQSNVVNKYINDLQLFKLYAVEIDCKAKSFC